MFAVQHGGNGQGKLSNAIAYRVDVEVLGKTGTNATLLLVNTLQWPTG